MWQEPQINKDSWLIRCRGAGDSHRSDSLQDGGGIIFPGPTGRDQLGKNKRQNNNNKGRTTLILTCPPPKAFLLGSIPASPQKQPHGSHRLGTLEVSIVSFYPSESLTRWAVHVCLTNDKSGKWKACLGSWVARDHIGVPRPAEYWSFSFFLDFFLSQG